ncbi:hypothetical protein O6H91_04G034100 [Diphasiastrum complanatum]|uniref:Uncharacterized protein n=3 Tax=Diphasiastrum complanatum TaxID=34168 RepID=A0ACC2DVU3_DIPCM|nr:hypothetical protein O6H91_Y478400 [Diphasiastrum complanatum]KAJ7298707.1 hypothetical protein O6H91_Y478400 [Diphasiastrum complanatum]KAJ7558334.1 hypothetical protein O6H91_04G034100 [Diphasiastrum complanatum]KAJ7558335.1 hypothetical protein O6H91_04G034100 [Diphasiastrum complanatum]KAJ7558336.1 hypothetical protein O6H91_04G034100 [Diphasiastrum complanatum]
MARLDGEERVLATAQHIVRSLGTTETMTYDMLNILSAFDNRFSGINKMLPKKQEPLFQETILASSSDDEFDSSLRTSLDEVEEVISQWETLSLDALPQIMIWDEHPQEGERYLKAVDEVQSMLESMSVSESGVSVDRAQNLLQLGMARLEVEFRHVLETNSRSEDPDTLLDYLTLSSLVLRSTSNGEEPAGFIPLAAPSFSSNQCEPAEAASSSSDDEDEDVPVAEPVTGVTIELLPSTVVSDLHEIAQRMVLSGYKRECYQVYGSVRKAALEGSLQGLGVEKLSIDEVQKMTREVLEGRIKEWIQAVKVGLKVLFASERQLCEVVFQDLDVVGDTLFADVARGSMMQLLNFGEAIAISQRSPERLFKILDMYETLRDLLPETCIIFSGEAFAGVRDKALEVVLRLGEAARGTFVEFENAIYRDASKIPVPGGAIHPLTKYVMNYIRFLFDYEDTFKQLFGDMKEYPKLPGDDKIIMANHIGEDERASEQDNLSPLAEKTISITTVLQTNLDGKSKLYKNPALTYLFLMNNLHYIVQKVKDSEVQALIGDDWVRKHSSLVRQHATNYQRSAWKKVLACLRDEGIRVSGSFSSGVSKVVLKERFKTFNASFEEVYKAQSNWLVPDSRLRLELQISVAEKVLRAYSSFVGRYGNILESEKHPQKYIKYAPEDLEAYLNDLFQGPPGSTLK